MNLQNVVLNVRRRKIDFLSRPVKIMKTFSSKKAHKIQLGLSKKIILKDMLPAKIKTIAGVDVSYVGQLGVGAAVVLDYNSFEVLETQVATCQVKIPYIPTLLSFRETPPAVAAIKKLKTQPDVFLADAQGIAHPYRCGFASHLGIILNKPTIGAAKSKLIGTPIETDGETFLIDKNEIIGAIINTKKTSKPVFVSIGHMVSLETAIRIIKHCTKNRIPEPLLQAHKLATGERVKLDRKSKVNITEN